MRTLTFLVLLFSSFQNFAQIIPNADFEEWEFSGWNLNPAGWITSNLQSFEPVTQIDDAYSGDYAMQVEALVLPLGQYGEAKTTFPISFIPASLNFAVRTELAFGAVQVRMTFYNQENEVTSYTWFSSEEFVEWTPVSLEMIQIEPIITHAEIAVIAEVGDLIAGTAIIQIDSLYFNFKLSAAERSNFTMEMYPNPASENVVISNLSASAEIRLYSLDGKLLRQQQIQTSNRMDVSDLNSGVYVVRAQDGSNTTYRKLVVAR